MTFDEYFKKLDKNRKFWSSFWQEIKKDKETKIEKQKDQDTFAKVEKQISFVLFYESQLEKFKRIGLGFRTEFGTLITTKLIKATEQRLNDIKDGVKTKLPKKCFISYRADTGYEFYVNKMPYGFTMSEIDIPKQNEIEKKLSQEYNDSDNIESKYDKPYIDKYTTAYRSEIMRAILKHNK